MAATDDVGRAEDEHPWLTAALMRHEQLTPIVVSLLKGVLSDRGIEYLSISDRTKDRASIFEKFSRKSYANPENQITDLTGLRVVTFFNSQVRHICDLIREIFDVDEENSLDKTKALGSNRVGYRSFHFVCILGNRRGALPEYGQLCTLKFEVQVRTVLQHGWAEITHDRSYKFGQALPTEIQRKLNLYAGTLEIVDAGFDEVARDIDAYALDLSKAAAPKLLNEPINSISINQLVVEINNKFNLRLEPAPDRSMDRLLNEYHTLGYSTLGEIWNLIGEDFVKSYKEMSKHNSGAGFLRILLTYTDPDKYFSVHTFGWRTVRQSALDLLSRKWGEEKMHELLAAHNLKVSTRDHPLDRSVE